jgi:hypothetical protein
MTKLFAYLIEKTLNDERQCLESIIERLRSEMAMQSALANEMADRQRHEVSDLYIKYNSSEAQLTRMTIELKKAGDEVNTYVPSI